MVGRRPEGGGGSARRRAPLLAIGVALLVGALGVATASAVRVTRDLAGGITALQHVTGSTSAPGATGARGLTGAAGARAATGPGPETIRPRTSPRAPGSRTLASRAVGLPYRGRLVRGVLLPAAGPDHTTWDAVLATVPNRGWRRVGTDRLVTTLRRVSAQYRRADPDAPRVVISDLSLPRGGRFGEEYGGLGHVSHQNGLDVDIAYPRRDLREIGVARVAQIDRRRAQALIDLFVAAGAQRVFVGPKTGLRGPARVVQTLAHHDDHFHVRLPNRR